MTDYVATHRAPFFQGPNLLSPRLGIVEEGTPLQGAVESGFVRTRIDSVAVDEGFIHVLSVEQRPSLPQPIPADGGFVSLLTRLARAAGADRDYLLAVAYCGTKNLTALGGAGDARIGPFQFTAQEWDEATATGPAAGRGFVAEDRFRWTSQTEVAALLAADAFKRFKDTMGRAPSFSELFFTQLYGNGALDVLRRDPATLWRDVIVTAPAGSFAAELAAGAGSIGQALDTLKARLLAGYLAARPMIDRQPPEIRFFRLDDFRLDGSEPPWLTVARSEMSRGVSETPQNKNTDDIKAYLAATNLPDLASNTPWCGAFLAFCMKSSGVPAIAESVRIPDAAGAGWWASWGRAVGAPFPAGTVVVLRSSAGTAGHVGLIVEGSDASTIRVLGGNQGGGGRGPDKVSIVPFPASQIMATRFLDMPVLEPIGGIDGKVLGRAGITAGSTDAKFVSQAPTIMRDLMRDFPGLTAEQAGGILGNIGHECGGFLHLHQIGMPPGRGGHGWCQWDGARREAFLQWAASRGLSWMSDEANYSYLVHELQTTERHAFAQLRRQTSLEAAVINFDQLFERSGVKNIESRLRYGRLAMLAFGG